MIAQFLSGKPGGWYFILDFKGGADSSVFNLMWGDDLSRLHPSCANLFYFDMR